MPHAKRTVHGLQALVTGRFISQLYAWLVTIVVIRLLKPEDYGLMAMAMIFIEFATLFNDLGVATALVQRKRLYTLLVRQAFGLLLLVNLAACFLLVGIAPLAADFFKSPELTLVIQVLALNLPLVTFGIVSDSLLRRRMRYRRKALAELVSVVIASSVTLVLAILDYGVWALVIGGICKVGSRSLCFIIAAKYFVWPSFSFAGTNQLIIFGRDVTLGSMLWLIYFRADIFVLGRMMGKVVLGVYAIALQVAAMPVEKIMGIVNDVGLSALSRLQTDPAQFQRQYVRATRIAAYFSFSVLWGISAVAPEIVTVILGETWQAAAMPLMILGLAMPIRLLSSFLPTGLMARGLTGSALVIRAIPAAVLPGAFVLGAQWGAVGVAIVWACIFPVLYLINLGITLSRMDMAWGPFADAILRPLLAGLLMWAAIWGTRAYLLPEGLDPMYCLPLLITTGAVVFISIVMLIQREMVQEFRAVLLP